MANMNMIQALNSAMDIMLGKDPSVVLMGEDIGYFGGVFRTTEGLQRKYGEHRVLDTPIAEGGIVAAAIGMSINGLRPVAEIQFADYIYPGFDQITSELARIRYRSAGEFFAPVTIRTPCGGGIRGGQTHSQSPEGIFTHVSGLKVVMPSNPYDAKGLLITSIEDDDPVIFFEHKSLYAVRGDVPDGEILDSLGTAKILRPGKDATILALALMVPRALEAAARLKTEHGIDCEVVDVRSLVPLDTQTILGSVGRTHRVFTVEENPRLCGWGAEIVSIIADEAFYDLDGPPIRITTPHIPLPAADVMEDMVLPTVDRITETVRRSLSA